VLKPTEPVTPVCRRREPGDLGSRQVLKPTKPVTPGLSHYTVSCVEFEADLGAVSGCRGL
jgi:hypothetical protein